MSKRKSSVHYVAYALVAALVVGGLWVMPELRRFRLIHSM